MTDHDVEAIVKGMSVGQCDVLKIVADEFRRLSVENARLREIQATIRVNALRSTYPESALAFVEFLKGWLDRLRDGTSVADAVRDFQTNWNPPPATETVTYRVREARSRT